VARSSAQKNQHEPWRAVPRSSQLYRDERAEAYICPDGWRRSDHKIWVPQVRIFGPGSPRAPINRAFPEARPPSACGERRWRPSPHHILSAPSPGFSHLGRPALGRSAFGCAKMQESDTPRGLCSPTLATKTRTSQGWGTRQTCIQGPEGPRSLRLFMDPCFPRLFMDRPAPSAQSGNGANHWMM